MYYLCTYMLEGYLASLLYIGAPMGYLMGFGLLPITQNPLLGRTNGPKTHFGLDWVGLGSGYSGSCRSLVIIEGFKTPRIII